MLGNPNSSILRETKTKQKKGMNVTMEWWKENCIFSGRMDGEELVEVEGKYLTHVASVRVMPPWDRDDLECSIYGEISVNLGGVSDDTRDFVTLYSRDRATAELMDLADYADRSYLTLSDHRESSGRPLHFVSHSKPYRPLLIRMKLYETMASEEQDILIADSFSEDRYCHADKGRAFEIEGLLGFIFVLEYSVVYGACVEVEVKINKVGDSDRRISMSGQIAAYQNLDRSPFGETITMLRVIDDTEPVTLNVGDDRIELDRRFVVAPMVYKQYLCVCIAPVIDDEFVEYLEVDFPLATVSRVKHHLSFWTNKEMTHTKDIHHNGIVFSVSITFVLPEVDKHELKNPFSLKWPADQRPTDDE